MKSRLALRNKTHGVEFADNGPGRMMAEAFRRSHPAFRGRKIRSIIQANPSSIPLGVVYELT